ncbi:MAG TPA: carbohydrate porin [Blastocatellia bacterium]|nr:carbohydrate porin [Blastocatellia bacterium]
MLSSEIHVCKKFGCWSRACAGWPRLHTGFAKIVAFALLTTVASCFPGPARAQSTDHPPLTAGSNQAAGSGTTDKDESTPVVDASSPDNSASPDELSTMFPHSQSSRFWISGQINTILQWHSYFPAKYSGINSLNARGENANSRVFTVYTGLQLSKTTEVFCDIEATNGGGLSQSLGLAGITNLDVVRNTTLGKTPYLARLLVREIIPLSKDVIEAERNSLALATSLPARRLEIRAGKFSIPDFFDGNSVGSDSHLQFMNWTVDDNGAYDYAADTRGYTWGVMAEYDDRGWAVRFGEFLMPTIANGQHLVWNLRRARAENLELELDHSLIRGRAGKIRLLAFVNHANMGSYLNAIGQFLAGQVPVPDITAHPPRVRVKYGFGVNIEQDLSRFVTGFVRLGWNDGHNESFAYTEVDNTAVAGAGLKGELWKRRLDRLGAVFVTNGISSQHARYLQLGGHGFLLGDGGLTYGREQIIESYYTVHLWRGVFGSFDLQHARNPGYNRDRGPVLIPSVRLHIDF